MNVTGLSFVPTKYSNYKKTAVQYQEVTFQNPSKRKPNAIQSANSVNNNYEPEEFDIKRAKFEIKKFAKSSDKPTEKQKTLKELAIELGARPPRKKCVNYKDILAQKQKEKQEQSLLVENVRLGKAPATDLKNQKSNKPQIKEKDLFLSEYGKATLKKDMAKDGFGKGRQNRREPRRK